MSRKWLAAATAGALALGVSACGSSGNSSSSTSASSTSGGSSSVTATLNGSGSTFAAPIYQQLGSELKGQGLNILMESVAALIETPETWLSAHLKEHPPAWVRRNDTSLNQTPANTGAQCMRDETFVLVES